MANYEMGPIDRVLLIGGGKLLFRLAVWAREAGFRIRVITAPRHAKEGVDGAGSATLLDALEQAGIDTVVVESIDSEEAREAVGDVGSAFALSFGAAWIFKRSTIDNVFRGKLFNLHGTRLPQNRGGGGFTWQVMMGNRLGFCVVHKVDEGVDTGEIVTYKEFIYPPSCRIPADYYRHYQDQNFDFIVALLESVHGQARAFPCMVQQEYLSTYWPRLHTPTHGWIDWNWSAAEIERFICAFDDPYPGARTLLHGRTVVLKKAFANYQDGYFHPAQAGLVYRINPGWLCVVCRDGAIVIEQLLAEDGNSLLQKVRVGDAFSTPHEHLGRNAEKAIYTPRDSEPKFRKDDSGVV